MKKITYFLLLIAAILTLSACNDDETYADRRNRENNAINEYIHNNNIKVLTESEFLANDTTTDVSQNEWVLFSNTGIYMQIINKGCGQKLKQGTTTVLCRYTEYNLLTDSIQSTNNVLYYSAYVDKMAVTLTSGTYEGVFDTGSSLMYSLYSSTAVPSGWLVPLRYINVGRRASDTDELAHVRIIVPSSQGQSDAATYTYPCLYDITYERGRVN